MQKLGLLLAFLNARFGSLFLHPTWSRSKCAPFVYGLIPDIQKRLIKGRAFAALRLIDYQLRRLNLPPCRVPTLVLPNMVSSWYPALKSIIRGAACELPKVAFLWLMDHLCIRFVRD